MATNTHTPILSNVTSLQPADAHPKRGRPSLSAEEKAVRQAARYAAQLALYKDMPSNALVRQPVVQILAAFSAASLWRKVKNRLFPAPAIQTGRFTAWRKGDVEAYLNGLSAA